MRLLELRGVSITPEGYLFKGGRILPETFSSPVICKGFLNRHRSVLKFFATNYLLRQLRRRADARADARRRRAGRECGSAVTTKRHAPPRLVARRHVLL
jgi:hypothetical protein